jgi:hypothetical protein
MHFQSFKPIGNKYSKDVGISFGLEASRDIQPTGTGQRLPSLIGYGLPVAEKVHELLLEFEK